MTLVSVCVPTYERPGMLAELTRTFLAQDHADRELCIVDDSRTDDTERLFATELRDPTIRYERNPENLGYARNLRRAILAARGDVIVVLGDDDLLASRGALRAYARAFEAAPDAHFAYANLVQIDEAGRCTLIYPFFEVDGVAPAGRAALERLLLRSILITGIGLRRTSLLGDLYPEGDVLFPQVELVGRLLLRHPGIGLASFACATRAHREQLGFRAILGRDIRGTERHGVVEVMEIVGRLLAERPDAESARGAIERQLVGAYTTNLPNEKILTGNARTTRNAVDLVRRNEAARRDPRLWLVYLAAMLRPRRSVRVLKDLARSIVLRRRLAHLGLNERAVLETRPFP